VNQNDRQWLPSAARSLQHSKCLSVGSHVVDRLVVALVLADALLGDLTTEESTPILWIEPVVREVYDNLDALVKRFAQ
jgi:hypothetical protein